MSDSVCPNVASPIVAYTHTRVCRCLLAVSRKRQKRELPWIVEANDPSFHVRLFQRPRLLDEKRFIELEQAPRDEYLHSQNGQVILEIVKEQQVNFQKNDRNDITNMSITHCSSLITRITSKNRVSLIVPRSCDQFFCYEQTTTSEVKIYALVRQISIAPT